MNYHKDCQPYSVAPYNYCWDDEYSAWMEWKCAKTCGYCNNSKYVLYAHNVVSTIHKNIHNARTTSYERSYYVVWVKTPPYSKLN